MKREGKIDNGGADSPDRRLTRCMQFLLQHDRLSLQPQHCVV